MKSKLHKQLAGNRKLLGSTDNGLTTQQKSMRLLWIVLCRLAHVKLGRLLPQSETETIVAQIPPRPTSKGLWGCWPKRGHDVGSRSLHLQRGRCRGGSAQLAADILFGHYCNGPVPPKPCPQAVLLLQGSRSGWLWCRACCLLTCHFGFRRSRVVNRKLGERREHHILALVPKALYHNTEYAALYKQDPRKGPNIENYPHIGNMDPRGP